MLTNCPECQKEISDSAVACPHCGHPAGTRASATAERRTPIFLAISIIAFLMCLGTPRLILALPVLACVVFVAVSFFRKEKFRGWGLLVGAAAVWLFVASAADLSRTLSAPTTDNLSAAKITDFNWNVDRSFGSHGTIKWNVTVMNLSAKPIRMAEVQLSTYDASGHLVTTSTTFVDDLTPGMARNESSYADLYGNESTAQAKLISVRFADQ